MLTIEDGEAPRQARIVGVVGDVKHYGLDAELTPDFYTPVPQVPDVTVQWLNNNMYWGVRTDGDPAALAESFRRALREVDADVPAAAIRTMNDALGIALAQRRLNLDAGTGVRRHGAVLAAAGVYAVTAFSVALRRREIAIRSVLGAGTIRTVQTVVGDALRPVVAGLIAGAAGALLAAPFLRAVLFRVEPPLWALCRSSRRTVRRRGHLGAVRRAADPAHRRDRGAEVGIEVSRSYSDRRNASRSAFSRSVSPIPKRVS